MLRQKILLGMSVLIFGLLFLTQLPGNVEAYNYDLDVDPRYSCDTGTGQWRVRFTWSGPTPPGPMELRIYEDMIPSSYPWDNEPKVGSRSITTGSGSYTWTFPKFNYQYIAYIEFFGQQSEAIRLVADGSDCDPDPSPIPSPSPVSRPDLVLRNSSNGTSPVVNVSGGGATLSGNTITVNTNSTFTISFNTRNIGSGSTVNNSRTVAENFTGASGNFTQWTVGNLSANTNAPTHSFSTHYTTTGAKPILLRVDADGTVTESAEGSSSNDVFLTVNVVQPAASPSPVPSPSPTPPATPTANVPTGLPTCVNSGSTYGQTVNLSWNAVNGATSYTVRLTRDVRTGGDAALKTVTTTSTTGTGGWGNGGNSLVTWISSGNLALQPGVTYFYAVSASGPGGTSPYDLVNKSAQIGPVSLCAPANPTFLIASGSCLGSNAQIAFRFVDNSNNEDQFIIEVNDRPWTSASAPSPWGTKTINRAPIQKAGAGGNVIFVWSGSNPLETGNANSTGGSALAPVSGKSYWWRVKAVVAGGPTSSPTYAGPLPSAVATTTPPGIPAVAPICAVDISITIDENSWRDSFGNHPGTQKVFEPKELVTFTARVVKAPGINSPATDLYVYYKNMGNQMPDCGLSPARSASSVPVDSNGQLQRYAVPILTDASPAVNINVSVSLDSVGGTLYAYVVPRCEFDSAPWGNNVASQTYTIETEGFIESRGGGVGALGNVSVSVKSSTLTPPIYQGDYIINAGTMNGNVDSRNNWIMKGYNQRQTPKGGLVEYFDTKFKGKTDPTCAFSHASQFRYCSGNLTFNATDVPPSVPTVFFVDGDLRFKKNFELGADSAMLFVVKGNVVVELGVKRVDAFIITKGTFTDTDVPEAGVAGEADALVVNGSVYSEKTTDSFELKRYFTTPINRTKPANIFVWDPKQVMKLAEIVGSSSIVWQEVAP